MINSLQTSFIKLISSYIWHFSPLLFVNCYARQNKVYRCLVLFWFNEDLNIIFLSYQSMLENDVYFIIYSLIYSCIHDFLVSCIEFLCYNNVEFYRKITQLKFKSHFSYATFLGRFPYKIYVTK